MEHYQPGSLQEALDLLSEKASYAIPVSGGTDVVVAINERRLGDRGLVSLSSINRLKGISLTDKKIFIGPLTTFAEIISSKELKSSVTLLPDAALQAASPQVRNMGTIGGNIGTGSPAGDLLPPLLVLNAIITLQSKRGTRVLPLDKLLLGPKEVDIASDELITQVEVERLPSGSGSSFVKIGKTRARAVSIASAAAAVILSKDKRSYQEVRLSFGSLAPTAVRVASLEAGLTESLIDAGKLDDVVKLVINDISPLTDNRATAWYRAEVAAPIAKKAIQMATDAALSSR